MYQLTNHQHIESISVPQIFLRSIMGLLVLLCFSIILMACQKKPVETTSVFPSQTPPTNTPQPTARIWFDDSTQTIQINPNNLSEGISGVTIRVKIKENTPNSSFKLSDPPFIISKSLLNQGWSAVINQMTANQSAAPGKEVWADLALINTLPSGIALSETTAIADLAFPPEIDFDDLDVSVVLDPKFTKMLTKSAQEVIVSTEN